jgi:hypothetical protein
MGWGEFRMQNTSMMDQTTREELKIRRKELFTLFEKNPAHISLAIEIKQMDDLLAIAPKQP